MLKQMLNNWNEYHCDKPSQQLKSAGEYETH